jgi:hypothetical protein
MLTEQTMEKLKSLRLDVFAAAWTEQQKNPEHVSLSSEVVNVNETVGFMN